ncbi:MAG: BrnT family toxin [Paracoccaceae bacterium]
MYEWDEAKQRASLEKHGVDFADMARFERETATVIADDRRDYGEARARATGLIDGRLHVLTITLRRQKLRVTSLRKANERETGKWEKP